MSMPELEFAQKALDESYKRGFNDCLAKVQNDFYIIPKQTMDEWGGNFAGLVNQLMNMIVPNAAEDIDEDNDPELPPGYEAPPAEEFFVEQSLEPEVLPPPPPPAAPTRRPGRKSAADPRSAAALARQAEQEAQNAAALLNVTPPGQ